MELEGWATIASWLADESVRKVFRNAIGGRTVICNCEAAVCASNLLHEIAVEFTGDKMLPLREWQDFLRSLLAQPVSINASILGDFLFSALARKAGGLAEFIRMQDVPHFHGPDRTNDC